jgi:hypothetical protein
MREMVYYGSDTTSHNRSFYMFIGWKPPRNKYSTFDELSKKIKRDLILMFKKRGIKVTGIVADIESDRLKIGLLFTPTSVLK